MTKLFAIIKREYMQRVRTRMFLIATLLGPVLLAGFGVVPSLIFKIKGDALRLAVVDGSGKMYERVRESLEGESKTDEDDADTSRAVERSMNAKPGERAQQDATRLMRGDYKVEQAALSNRSIDDVKQSLRERVSRNELDAYIVLPPDILESGRAEFYGRNVGDIATRSQLANRLSRAVIEQRMIDANIDQTRVRELSKRVTLSAVKVSESGEEKDSGGAFILVFILGGLIYVTLLMYGQVVLAAVIEEKETRIAEVMFSAVSPFQLLMGKLIGVSLVALTQYAIWGLAVLLFALYGVGAMAASGIDVPWPSISPSVFVYFILFFLMGYFVYSTIYALVGSMVTTTQEGGQIALPVIFLLVIAFYLVFPVLRSPNSPFAFWMSMVPFFSPIIMLVRIVAQTPPFWQIALSFAIGVASIIGLVWLAARIYRIGMLMYGKRATIPEVVRWIRQT